MPRWASLLLFAMTSVVILTSIHYYLWRRLIHDTGLHHPWRRVVSIVIVLGGVSIPLAMWTTRLIDARLGLHLGWPAFVWLGYLFLLFLGFLAIDAIRMLRWSARHGRALIQSTPASVPQTAPLDPERRRFFARVAGGTVATAATGTLTWGMREALKELNVAEVAVTLPRLPVALDGFTIAHLTDIHVGFTISRGFVEGLVARTNALEPDLIAITGDLVDGDVPTLAHAVAPLGELRARHGVFFVTGNHEFFSGADPWVAELRRLGITVLRNQHVRIGEGNDGFDLAGIEDHDAGRLGGEGPDLTKALAGRDPARELVLLAHQPRQVLATEGHGVGLQLSGHTHGGQIWPWHYAAQLQQGFLAGLHRHGDTQLYVSRGTGYWGPPVRVGAPAEIAKIVLRAARA